MGNKLVLELVADANGLIKSMEQAQKSVNQFVQAAGGAGSAIGGPLNQAMSAFTNLAKGGGAAAGVLAGGIIAATTAAVLMTTSAGKQIEVIDHLSQKTGIAVQTLQQWSVIMAQDGIEAQNLTGSMRTLSKLMTQAKDPASAAAAAFDEMGVAITDLGSTESTIRAVADRFKAMPDGADKARIAVQLFGKAGLDMIPMLNRGSQAFDDSRLASERFGVVLKTEQVGALLAVDNAADNLGVALDGLKLQLSATFASSVEASINAITNAIAGMTGAIMTSTSSFSSFFEELKRNHPLISSMLLGSVSGHAAPPPLFPPAVLGPQQDAQVGARDLENGRQQEDLGKRIVLQLSQKFKLLQAAGHAQESLGKVTVDILRRETEERNKDFGMMLDQEEAVRTLNLEMSKTPTSGPFVESINRKEEAIRNLVNIMPELSREEAIMMAISESDKGLKIVQATTEAWHHRNDVLDDAVSMAQALDENQRTLYQSEAGLLGASDAARRVRMSLIDAEAAKSRASIDEQIMDETRKAEAIQRLEIETDTKRRNAIQQFPSFFEQQMQAIVASNVFSMGSMVSTWTGGIAQMAVHGGNLQQVWEQTQVAIVQASLNGGVQLLAQAALHASTELGLFAATEASKDALRVSSETIQTATATAGAAAREAIAAGEAATSIGFFATVGVAAKAMFFETIVPAVIAVGEFIMGVLAAIAEAMADTIFGIPVAILIVAGIAAIAVALAATGNLGFKEGGIGNFGSGTQATLHGQEAIIPLNSRGAAFMQDAMGGGGGGHMTLVMQMDGREIARRTMPYMPGIVHMKTGMS